MSPHTRKTLGRFAVTVLFVLALVVAFRALLWVAGTGDTAGVVAWLVIFILMALSL